MRAGVLEWEARLQAAVVCVVSIVIRVLTERSREVVRQETLPGPGASWLESRLGFENLGAMFFQGTLEQEEPEKQAGTRQSLSGT